MNQMPTELHEILYCSQLAAGQSPEVVGTIVSQARARNAEHGITGLLVFDGQRFCQHLEGPRGVVTRLMNRIGEDPRHDQIRVVYDGALQQRRYLRFDMGFAQTEDPDDMAGIHALDGPLALARFLELRPRFDI
jgi:hypothetical protein